MTPIDVLFFKDGLDENGSGKDESGESGSDDGSTEEGGVEGESGDELNGKLFKPTSCIFESPMSKTELLPISPKRSIRTGTKKTCLKMF